MCYLVFPKAGSNRTKVHWDTAFIFLLTTTKNKIHLLILKFRGRNIVFCLKEFTFGIVFHSQSSLSPSSWTYPAARPKRLTYPCSWAAVIWNSWSWPKQKLNENHYLLVNPSWHFEKYPFQADHQVCCRWHFSRSFLSVKEIVPEICLSHEIRWTANFIQPCAAVCS